MQINIPNFSNNEYLYIDNNQIKVGKLSAWDHISDFVGSVGGNQLFTLNTHDEALVKVTEYIQNHLNEINFKPAETLHLLDNLKEFEKLHPGYHDEKVQSISSIRNEVLERLLNKVPLHNAPKELKDNDDFVLAAIKEDSRAIKFASDRLQSNKEFLFKAISEDPELFKYIPKKFQNNPEFLLEMLQVDSRPFTYISNKLRSNIEFILKFLGAAKFSDVRNSEIWKNIPENLQNNKEVVQKIVNLDGKQLEFVPLDLKNDKEIAKTAVRSNYNALDFIPIDLREDKDVINAAIENLNIIYSSCIFLNLFPSMKLQTQGKQKFNFLLDKMGADYYGIKSIYQGGDTYYHARYLISSMQTVLQQPDSVFTIEFYEKIIKSLLTLFVSAQTPDDIIKEIHNIADHPRLFATGCQGHSMLLSVEKKENGKYKLVLFNTGQGVSKYHSPLDNKKYQTYLVVDDIPAQKLNDKELWKGFLAAEKSPDVDAIYTWFKGLGTLSPPSGNQFDYDPIQMLGTCPAQCLMAWMRYYIMHDLVKGNYVLEKLGVYKFIKARTFEVMSSKDDTSILDIFLRGYLNKNASLHHSDTELLKIALDLDKKDFKKLLDSIDEYSQAWKEADGMFARYYALKAVAKHLAEFPLERPKQPLKTHQDILLDYAFNYRHKKDLWG